MMRDLSARGQGIVQDAAWRYGVAPDAVGALLEALAAGNGSQAQFNHPDLGGMGQWSRGGMIMIGDMFNNALKAKVDALCNDLSAAMAAGDVFAEMPRSNQQGGGWTSFGGGRWPAELGSPSSSGSQNDMHYAFFPQTRRLAIEQGGRITIYDTADHMIGGVSQGQSGGQTLSFTSQYGPVRLDALRVVSGGAEEAMASAPPTSPPPPRADERMMPSEPTQPASARPDDPPPTMQAPAAPPAGATSASPADDLLGQIERLHGLMTRGILTADEFAAKKAELLKRI